MKHKKIKDALKKSDGKRDKYWKGLYVGHLLIAKTLQVYIFLAKKYYQEYFLNCIFISFHFTCLLSTYTQ